MLMIHEHVDILPLLHLCRETESNKRLKWNKADNRLSIFQSKKKVQALSNHYTKWLISYSCVYIINGLFILTLCVFESEKSSGWILLHEINWKHKWFFPKKANILFLLALFLLCGFKWDLFCHV